MKSHPTSTLLRWALCLTTFSSLLTHGLHSQLLSNDTGGGAWSAPGTWATGVVPTNQSFRIVGTDAVTMGEGDVYSSNQDPWVAPGAALTVGSGASLTLRRLNSGATAVSETPAVVNITGGSFAAGRVVSVSYPLQVNVSAGSFHITDSIATTGSLFFNVSGGEMRHAIGTVNNVTLSGGLLDVSGKPALGGLVWTGGTLANIYNIDSNTERGRLNTQMGAGRTLDLSNQRILNNSTNTNFAGVNLDFRAGTVQFDVYGPTNGNADVFTANLVGGNYGADGPLTFSVGSGLGLSGPASSFQDVVYPLIALTNVNPNYGSLAGTLVPNSTWTIDGVPYTVAFTNNLHVDGSISVLSLTEIPEAPTAVALAGIFLAALLLRRFRGGRFAR